MKYLPRHRLVFIHIPKDAGMSLRQALSAPGLSSFAPLARDLGLGEAEAERVTEQGTGFDHPALGRIHPAHLPLAAIQEEMPATWAAIRASRAFALTRAPRARFVSALMQRLTEFRDAGTIRADDPVVRREAEAVCRWLAGRGPFTDIEYIHFARQVDFVEVRTPTGAPRRIVGDLFPIDRMDAVANWLRREAGLTVRIPHAHARREPKRWARPVQPVARFVGRSLVPRPLRQALHPVWTASAAFVDAAGRYGGIDLGAEVESFIAAHYAADAALHAEATARVREVEAVP